MNRDTGSIRMLDEKEQPKPTERVFNVGEVLMVDDCFLKIISIKPAPDNEVVLKGIPSPVLKRDGFESVTDFTKALAEQPHYRKFERYGKNKRWSR